MPLAATDSPYEQHRTYVLSVLSRRCGWLDHAEREAALHDAYLVLLEKQHSGDLDVDAMNERQIRAYLVQTAIHKGLDEGKRAGRTRERSLDDVAYMAPDLSRGPDEQAALGQTNAQVREIIAELPERRQTIIKLRFFFERTPDEIQRHLGISERVYRRELERGMRQIARGYELVREERFCESRHSAILAFVAGVAGPNRAREARQHLTSCSACAHWAVELREGARKVGALAPLPAVAPAGWTDRVGRLAESIRDTVGGHASAAKQHALEAATRVDASAAGYATAARPGTFAAAIAGCIAIGSGATYCVVEGIPDPLRLRAGAVEAKKPNAREHARNVRTTAPSAPAIATPPPGEPASTGTAARPAPAKPAATPAQIRRERQRVAARRAEVAATREFGFEEAVPSTAAPAPAAGPERPAAAPVPPSNVPSRPPPAGPPGEFDP